MGKARSNGNLALELVPGSDAGVAPGHLAPRADWSEMGESDHFVQFYEADAALLHSLGGYVTSALVAGDAALVVATREHREGLEAELEETGLDVAAAVASGQFVALDAAETLSTFMVDGQPDPGRFAEVIGGLIEKAALGRARLRAYGEMVALLWTDGNRDAALRLEELWNDLGKTHPFSLFCAYPMSGFGGAELCEPLAGVCTSHTRVIPAESYTALADPDARLRIIIELQQKATTLEAEIADRKAAEERLRASLVRERSARAEAEKANRLKDEFLATASHELRTPLTAIIGWSQLLRSGTLDEATAARAVQTIERNANSQARLIEDILDVSRVITGKLRLNIEPVDAASVINAAIDSVQLAADAKGIRLEVTLDASARRICGDPSRLQQVVWNLLSNAIKFTPSGGRVAVRLERAGSDVQISVSDTGDGIRPDFLPFVFDRFRQADGTSMRQHGGLGLGLSIVRHLVELHGGTVQADSPGEGCGTTFTIRLPLASTRKNTNGRAGASSPAPLTRARLRP